MAPVTGSTLWELLARRAAASPDDLMLADDHGRRLTFSEFHDWAERVAAGLHGAGVREGTVVSWQLPSRLETIALSMALSRLGAVQNPIIHLYREREVASLLRTTGASWFFVPGMWRGFDYAAMARSIQERAGLSFVIMDGYADLPVGEPSTLPPPPADGDAIRWLYATSGTTSEPKAVCHTDQTLIAGGIGIAEALQPAPGSINAIPFPYAHIGGAVAVIGLPDDERGERVCAVIETATGAQPMTFPAMAAHCRGAGLMTQKIPEQLEVVDALPRNPTMKILERVLVDQLTRAGR